MKKTIQKIGSISDRRLIVIDIVITFLIVLGLLYLVWYEYRHAISATAYHTCTSLNTLKNTERKLFVVIPPPNETAAEHRYITNLINQAEIAFQPINCHTGKSLPAPPITVGTLPK